MKAAVCRKFGFTTVDLGQDLVDAGGPDKRFRMSVVLGQVLVDGALQVAHSRKAAAPNPFLTELAKPPVDKIQPRRSCRGVVKMEAPMRR
jgi:hypothetical protein